MYSIPEILLYIAIGLLIIVAAAVLNSLRTEEKIDGTLYVTETEDGKYMFLEWPKEIDEMKSGEIVSFEIKVCSH